MKNPQTLASNLATQFPNKDMQIIADNACCAFVVLWCLGIEIEDIEAIQIVQKMRLHNVIESDCTVKWFDVVKYATGRELKKLEKVNITSLKGIKERTPVLMACEGNAEGIGHWVGVEKGRIKFNPKSYSKNVAEGRPVQMRKLIF